MNYLGKLLDKPPDADSVVRTIAELPDDAANRAQIAETKRRHIVELMRLQNREFTHTDKLEHQRRRLDEVNLELEQSTTAGDGLIDNENAVAA